VGTILPLRPRRVVPRATGEDLADLEPRALLARRRVKDVGLDLVVLLPLTLAEGEAVGVLVPVPASAREGDEEEDRSPLRRILLAARVPLDDADRVRIALLIEG
jgi:hypothetical protein